MHFVKSYGQTCLTLLKLVWVKGSEVNIPTKFEGNVRKLKFCEFYAYVIVYTFYGLEIFEIYRANCHGLIMNKIYKETEIYLK